MIRKSILLLLIITLGFCTQTLAYTSDDIEWVSNVDSTTLHWGDSVTNGDYVITAEDFNEDAYVYITIHKDDQLLEFAPLHVGNSLSADDEIRVNVKSVATNIDSWTGNMVDPTAAIQIYRRGLPGFKITIETDEDSYDPKSYSSPPAITATITIENNGDAEVENVDLTINTGDLELTSGSLTHQFLSILKDQSADPVTVMMKVPILWDENSYTISAEAKGYDIKGAEYSGTGSRSVTVKQKWGMYLTKSMTEEIYMGDTAYVLINVRNSGICDLNLITVADSVIEGLELKDSVTLEKVISLKAGESTRELFRYALKPVTPGTYTAPAATAKFTAANGKEYTVSSDTPQIVINGPNIVLTKTVSSSNVVPEDEVTVTVNVQNTGNRDASVTVSDPADMLPANTTFVSGETGFKDVLKQGSSKSFTYIIRMDAEADVKLPAASASFVDLEGYKGEKISNMPVITVALPAETDTTSTGGQTAPVQDGAAGQGNDGSAVATEEKTDPGFEAVLAGAAIACVYLLSRRKN